MRRKTLQDVVNSLSAMAVADGSPTDLELLLRLPDGAVHIDLLNHTAIHDAAGPVNLEVVSRLADWLRQRLDTLSIPVSGVRAAVIQAQYRTDRVPTNRTKIVSFDWRAEAILASDEKEYRGLAEKHLWHTRRTAT